VRRFVSGKQTTLLGYGAPLDTTRQATPAPATSNVSFTRSKNIAGALRERAELVETIALDARTSAASTPMNVPIRMTSADASVLQTPRLLPGWLDAAPRDQGATTRGSGQIALAALQVERYVTTIVVYSERLGLEPRVPRKL